MSKTAKKKLSHGDVGKSFNFEHVLTFALVVVFFAGVIVFYHQMLYNERRDSLIRNGQATVVQSTYQLSSYFSTCIDVVKLTAYSVEELIADGRSNQEILDYLMGQSVAVPKAVFKSTTGVYGYIRGGFLDGTGWDPVESFIPTERPWYIKAMASDDEIVFVDPYVDAHTGKVMMTIAKRLSDGQSVVAMDLELNRVQAITEEAVASGNADYEIILDTHDIVVAHSDRGEIGKNYADEKNTFGALLLETARNNDGDHFEMKYGGAHYIVYVEKIENDWRCLSVKDATGVFKPLKGLLAFTALVVLFVVVVIAYIMNDSNRRYQISKQLNKQLSSIANIYMSMYDVDVDDDSFVEIKSGNTNVAILMRKEHTSARAMVDQLVWGTTDKAVRKDMLRFVNLDTLAERLKNTETVSAEFMTLDGTWLRTRFIVAERAKDGRPTRVLLVAEDIDKEKKERDALIDISERAVAASEAKSSFLSNMSHEIRTPINAVLGMNEMILRECEDDNILSYAENIQTAGDTLLGLINDILDFSKIEAGKVEIIPVEYDLSTVLNDLVNMVQARANDKGLSITLDFDRETPKLLCGDEVRVKQVITNILTNAVKYTEKGSVTFSVHYERTEDPDSVVLIVAVKDTGIGIKSEDMGKLFTEFERIEEKRNRNVEGTGLGMAITQSLLGLMGSSLQVKSTYGLGSTFYFRLVQKVVKWEPLGDYEASYHAMIQSRQKYHEKFTAPEALVLVADDNPMNLMVFKSLLKQTRIKIETAGDGDEGLLMAQNKKYDVIFLDHMMPKKDGIETLHELRSQAGGPNIDTPAVCLTANAITGAREQYIEAGFDDYLTKPIDSGKLEETLLAYLPKEKIQAADDTEADNTGAQEIEIPEILAPLRGQDWIDLPRGIKNSGSPEAYLPLLKIFYVSLDETPDEIEGYYREENWKDYTIKVHALKSSARLIGATTFGEEAQLLENAGKAGDIDYIRAHHEAFMAKYRSFATPLSKVFTEKETDEGKPEADTKLMEWLFKEIRSAAEKMDDDRLEELVAEIGAYRIPKAHKELYGKLKAAAARFDYKTILKLLTKTPQ